jgi:hypothetical protein
MEKWILSFLYVRVKRLAIFFFVIFFFFASAFLYRPSALDMLFIASSAHTRDSEP